VTFDTNVSGISCGITDSSGTVQSDCSTLSFAATVLPGQTAFLRGTLNYHYTDDGLPVPFASIPVSTGVSIPVSFEAGVVLFTNNICDPRYCSDTVPPTVDFTGSPGPSTPLLFGLNDQSDDLTGSIDLFVTVSVSANTALSYATTLFIGAQPIAISAPVPEPATLALMAGGLLLGCALRRRCGV
jgi:hypothetical protein